MLAGMMNSSVFLLFVLSWIINRRVLAAVLLNIAGEAFSRNPLSLTAFHLFAQRDQLADPGRRDFHRPMRAVDYIQLIRNRRQFPQTV